MSSMFIGPGAIAPSVVYQNFTPVWTGSISNPVLNNGTIASRWTQLGKMVHYYGEIDFGSGTTFGSGTLQISTPVTAVTLAFSMGSAYVQDVTAGTHIGNGLPVIGGSDAFFKIVLPTTYGGAYLEVTGTSPFTLGSGGAITWNLLYEAA